MQFHSPESRAKIARLLSFKPKEHQRRQVAFLTVKGYPARAIADTVGISVETLRKHFAAELATPAEPSRPVDVLDWLLAPPSRASSRSTPLWPRDRRGFLKLPGERRFHIYRSCSVQDPTQ